MGYVIAFIVFIVFVMACGMALAIAASGFGPESDEERRRDDEAQAQYLREWQLRHRKKRKRS